MWCGHVYSGKLDFGDLETMGGWIEWHQAVTQWGLKPLTTLCRSEAGGRVEVQGALLARDNWVGGLGMGVRK